MAPVRHLAARPGRVPPASEPSAAWSLDVRSAPVAELVPEAELTWYPEWVSFRGDSDGHGPVKGQESGR